MHHKPGVPRGVYGWPLLLGALSWVLIIGLAWVVLGGRKKRPATARRSER
jgi:hypothetical protein